MPRIVPDPPTWQEPSGGETITLHLNLITPMFGGGYEPRQVDPLMPIRPAAIRGHLRFWWRATRGAAWAHDLAELARHETNLWGSMAVPGAVGIRVRDVGFSPPAPCARPRVKRDGTYFPLPDFLGKPGYALHPFQGKYSRNHVQEEPANAVYFGSFVVDLFCRDVHGRHVTFSDGQRQDVMSAVSAWVLYGGVGARTRRGCGSLTCSDELPAPILVAPKVEPAFPVLYGAQEITGDATSPCQAPAAAGTTAWRAAVEVYRDFRQAVGFARDQGPVQNQPGRSRWPEPNAIRRIAEKHSPYHRPGHGPNMFPRADLGLPIIFHFKDYDDRHRPADDPKNDPADATLEGPADGTSRFASPVITKAVQTGDRFVPLILVLNAPHVWVEGDLRLRYMHRNQTARVAPITRTMIDLAPADRAAIHPLHANGDQPIREALIAYIEARWETTRRILL